jgi:hypothetical protein
MGRRSNEQRPEVYYNDMIIGIIPLVASDNSDQCLRTVGV